MDYTTGLYSAIAILAALNKRSLTGEGEHIDVALYDCAVALMSIHLQNTLLSGRDASRTGIYNPFVAPYQVFKALDKHFVLAIGNDRQFFKFCQLIGEEDLCQSDKYKTNYARLKHRQELEQIISSRVKTRSADEWIDIFRANDIPAGPINTAKEILNDEQVKSRQIVFQIEHPLLKPEDKLSMISCPIRFEGNSVVNSKISPPIRGQDTVSVLSAYGLSESELVLLKKNKVIE